MRGFGAAGGKGLNVTVPHKEAAYALVDEISAPADAAGAVNTIKFLDGKLYGENTDGVGLIRDLVANQHQTLPGEGFSCSVPAAPRAASWDRCSPRSRASSWSRTAPSDAPTTSSRIFNRPAGCARSRSPSSTDLPPFDLLLNATSAGLKGEAPPFPASLIGPQSFCYDLVYSVNDTPFVLWARQHAAARAVQGWGMLIEQAAESFFIWRGVRPDTKPILKQLVALTRRHVSAS